jgi:hypothetical protein
MFVQTARSATALEQRGARFTLTLHGTPATVLRFDDRPQRRSSRFSVDRFVDLWRRGFADDPPNAALVGSHRGRSTQTVVELLAARRIRGGMRYTVRTHNGRPPRQLRDVSLFVDPLPFNPGSVPVTGMDVVIQPGTPLIVQPTEGPFVGDFNSVSFMPGGALQFVGVTNVTLSFSNYDQAAAAAAASSVPPTTVYVDPSDGGAIVGWRLTAETSFVIRPATALTLSDVILVAE